MPRYDFTPKYAQIRDELSQSIVTGVLPHGAVLPSIRQISDDYGVSPITARRVLADLKALGLIESRPGVGSFVSSKRSPTNIAVAMIGYLNIDWRQNSGMFGQLVGGISSAAWLHGALLTVLPIDNSAAAEDQIGELLDRQSVDGILLRVAADLDWNVVDRILQRGVHVVLIKRRVPGRRIPAVLTDTYRGGHLSIGHLFDLGHRRIGVIESTSSREHYLAHLRGVRDAAHENRLTLPDEHVIKRGKPLAEEGYAATKALMSTAEAPTAIVVNSDFMVPGVYECLADLGLRVPDDVSVIGHDDVEFAALLSPALTTISSSYYDLGEASANMLFQQMQAQVMPIERTQPVHLVIRDSTAPPRTAT